MQALKLIHDMTIVLLTKEPSLTDPEKLMEAYPKTFMRVREAYISLTGKDSTITKIINDIHD